MTTQRLDRIVTCYRIGDPNGAYPIYNATGSRLYPGRWNKTSTSCLYASEHYSTAMLEKLVHGSGHLPPNQHFITIAIPTGLTCETIARDKLPGWDTQEPSVSRDFGAKWLSEARSVVLIVPSYVARLEHNIVINPAHEEFEKIEHSHPEPVWWDERLFD